MAGSFIRSFLPLIVILLAYLSVQVSAIPGFFAPPQESPGQHLQRSHSAFPQLTWLRNTAIERIFGVPKKTKQCDKSNISHSSSQLPSNLFAQYGGDLVLRFNLTTPADEEALAEAANTLFLDVWEFTSNWADIRLRADDVC